MNQGEPQVEKNVPSRMHNTKLRVITKQSCLRDIAMYLVFLAFAFGISVTFPAYCPFSVLFATWAYWLPGHAIRNLHKIGKTGKTINVSTVEAWLRYSQGMRWSAIFFSCGAFLASIAYLCYALAQLAIPFTDSVTRVLLIHWLPVFLAEFWLGPALFWIMAHWSRKRYKRARQIAVASEEAVAAVSPTFAPSRWWTNNETRDEIQQAGRR